MNNIKNKDMMMKRLIFLLLLAMPALWLSAEKTDFKSWSDGPLTWNDFKGTSVIPNSLSYMKVSLGTTPTEQNVGGNAQLRLSTSAVMDRNASFADTTARTDQRLRYHQLQFDQLELYRRRLQNDLNSGMTGIEAQNRQKYYQNLYYEQLADMDRQTSRGTDDHKLQEWEYYTRKTLEEMGLPNVPEIVASNYCYGMYLGVGGLFPSSSIKDDFTGCFTFTAGLTGGYKRLKLKTDITYGQPQFNNTNVFGLKDNSGRDVQGTINTYASYLGIGVSAGFTVFDGERLAVTPHVGMYWSNYGWTVANYAWEQNTDGQMVNKITGTENVSLKDYNWMAGIDFDIKFHNYVSNTPFFLTGQREQLSSSIRITPYVARAAYDKANPSIRGYQIGFTVSYAGIARSLHIK